MVAGPAGLRLPEGLAALPRRPGFVFTGGDWDLVPGCYRLRIAFDRASFVRALTNNSGYAYPSGLVLEVMYGATSVGLRPVAVDELARGTLSVEFAIRPVPANDRTKTSFHLFSTGQTGLTISGITLERIDRVDAAADIATFNFVPMLAVGPSGERGAGPGGRGRAIHAKPDVPGLVAHFGDNDVAPDRPKRMYDGLYNSLWLPPGRYEAKFEFVVGEFANGGAIRAYVIAQRQALVLAKGTLEPKAHGAESSSLSFEVGESMPVREEGLLEFLVWSGGRIRFSLTTLTVRRTGENAKGAVSANVPRGHDCSGPLRPASAGMRLPDGVVSLPTTGFVLSGTPSSLSTGSYQLLLNVESGHGGRPQSSDSGLGLEICHGSTLLAFREVSGEDLERGEISTAFNVPSTSQGTADVEARLWTTGLAEILVCGARVEAQAACEDLVWTEIDATLLLSVGPAGERVPLPDGRTRVAIHAKRGVAGNVSHGPYVWLPAGRYAATFDVIERGLNEDTISVDVVASLGTVVFARGALSVQHGGPARKFNKQRWKQMQCVLEFDVPARAPRDDNDRLEFRTWSTGSGEFFLTALRLKKLEPGVSGDR